MGKLVALGAPVQIEASSVVKTWTAYTPTDDLTIEIEIYDPSGVLIDTAVVGDMTNPSDGVYWYSHIPTEVGVWTYRVTGAVGARYASVEVVDDSVPAGAVEL